MFEKLIQLIDKWNSHVKEYDRLKFIYGFDDNSQSIHFFKCSIRLQKSNFFKFGTPDIESMYYKMNELYNDRFIDPQTSPERFKITEIEPVFKAENIKFDDGFTDAAIAEFFKRSKQHDKRAKLIDMIKQCIDRNLSIPKEWLDELGKY